MSRPKPQLQAISIPAASLASGLDAYIKLPFTSDFLFLPLMLPISGAGFTGNGDNGAVYGIRLNDPHAQQLLFGINPDADPFVVVEATVDSIYICRLDGSSGSVLPLTLLVGTDCDLGSMAAVF
jgi:hypothetical protein